MNTAITSALTLAGAATIGALTASYGSGAMFVLATLDATVAVLLAATLLALILLLKGTP